MGHRYRHPCHRPPDPPKSDPWTGVIATLVVLYVLGSLQSMGALGWLMFIGIAAAAVWIWGKER